MSLIRDDVGARPKCYTRSKFDTECICVSACLHVGENKLSLPPEKSFLPFPSLPPLFVELPQLSRGRTIG